MTEEQWLAATDPTPMLEALRASGRASVRKLRLFTLACCNRVRHLVPEHMEQQEFKFPDVFTAGRVEELDARLFRAGLRAAASVDSPEHGTDPLDLSRSLLATANVSWATARIVTRAVGGSMGGPIYRAEAATQAALVRDIFGCPFRPPPPIDPAVLAWSNGTVVELAQAIYAEDGFARLPALADTFGGRLHRRRASRAPAGAGAACERMLVR
jgi:hypothetical protein